MFILPVNLIVSYVRKIYFYRSNLRRKNKMKNYYYYKRNKSDEIPRRKRFVVVVFVKRSSPGSIQ